MNKSTDDTSILSSITLTTGQTLDSGQLELGLEPLDFNSLQSNTYHNNIDTSYQYPLNGIQPLTTLSVGSINTSGINISNTGTSIGTTWQNNGTYSYESPNETQIRSILKKELKPVLERLAILENPNPEVLEIFESLKLAYNHYRTLEALMTSEIEKINKK